MGLVNKCKQSTDRIYEQYTRGIEWYKLCCDKLSNSRNSFVLSLDLHTKFMDGISEIKRNIRSDWEELHSQAAKVVEQVKE